jgi:hypothetical protein
MLLTDLSPTVHNSPTRCGLYLTLSLGHVLPHCGASRKLPNLSPTPHLLSAIPRPFGFNSQVWPGAKMSPLHKLHTRKKYKPQAKFKRLSKGLLHPVKQVRSEVSERLVATVFRMNGCGSVGRWNSHPEYESSTFLRNVVRILPYMVK